jgi:hypothetical protein
MDESWLKGLNAFHRLLMADIVDDVDRSMYSWSLLIDCRRRVHCYPLYKPRWRNCGWEGWMDFIDYFWLILMMTQNHSTYSCSTLIDCRVCARHLRWLYWYPLYEPRWMNHVWKGWMHFIDYFWLILMTMTRHPSTYSCSTSLIDCRVRARYFQATEMGLLLSNVLFLAVVKLHFRPDSASQTNLFCMVLANRASPNPSTTSSKTTRTDESVVPGTRRISGILNCTPYVCQLLQCLARSVTPC